MGIKKLSIFILNIFIAAAIFASNTIIVKADISPQMYKDPAAPVLEGEMSRLHFVEVLEVYPEEELLMVNNSKDNRVYELVPFSPATSITDKMNKPITFWDINVGDKLFVRDLGVKDYVIKAELIQMTDEENYASHGGIAILGEERFDVHFDQNSNYAFSVRTFPDVSKDHKYAKAIEYLRFNGYVRGYNDGTFGPDKHTTRSEALKFLLFGAGVGVNPDEVQTTFIDIDPMKWYAPYVKRAHELNIIHGYADNSFKPDDKLKRAEALKIIFHAMGYVMPESVIVKPYVDVSVEEWPAPYFHYAKERNLFATDDEDIIRPWDYITRAELADLMYRIIVVSRTNAIRYEKNLDPYNELLNKAEDKKMEDNKQVIPKAQASDKTEDLSKNELHFSSMY